MPAEFPSGYADSVAVQPGFARKEPGQALRNRPAPEDFGGPEQHAKLWWRNAAPVQIVVFTSCLATARRSARCRSRELRHIVSFLVLVFPGRWNLPITASGGISRISGIFPRARPAYLYWSTRAKRDPADGVRRFMEAGLTAS